MSRLWEEAKKLRPVAPSDVWSAHRENLRNLLLDHGDWEGFKLWSTIVATMYTGDPRLSDPLMKYVRGTRWEKELEGYDLMNGTAIDQAYNLALYEDVTGCMLSRSDGILEFGGGYGEMARLVYGKFVPSWYLVYDFPEVCVLQKWYWGKHLDGGFKTPQTTCDLNDTLSLAPSLLISLCGISETPLDIREEFLDGFSADSVIFRFQDGWEGIDNEEFFEKFVQKNYRNVHSSRAPNHVGHRCLIAWGLK